MTNYYKIYLHIVNTSMFTIITIPEHSKQQLTTTPANIYI